MATKEKKPTASRTTKAKTAKTPSTSPAPAPDMTAQPAEAAPKAVPKPKKSTGISMDAVRKLAREKGAKIGGLGKTEAIRAIQIAEGYTDCFGRAGEGHCDQEICLFREDCLAMSKPVAI